MADIEEMETEQTESSSGEEHYTMKKLFTTRELHMPLLVAVMLQMIQQLSGINAVSDSYLFWTFWSTSTLGWNV